MSEIRVTCKVADTLPYDQIEPLQGILKKRTEEQLDKICRSIIKHGWAFPEFIWKHEEHNYCIDGHGRQEAIPILVEKGYAIPLIPVVYIEAKDRSEAKELLLKCISKYGTVTEEGFAAFLDFNCDFIDFEIPEIYLLGSKDIGLDVNDSDFSLQEDIVKKPKVCPYCGATL
jgi:hypothetical protein